MKKKSQTKKVKQVSTKAKIIKWLVMNASDQEIIEWLSPALPKGHHIHKDPIKKEKAVNG